MNSHELLRQVFDDAGGCKTLATKIPVKQSLLYRWSMPSQNGSGVDNPLDRIEAILKATNDKRVAQWVCEKVNGHFTENPQHVSRRGVVLDKASSKIVQDLASMLSLVTQVAEDGKITEEESRSLRTRWNTVKTETETFVRCCEERNFAGIQEHRETLISNSSKRSSR